VKRLKQLSTRRVRDYDYSQPGVHHVLLETKDDAEILGTAVDGVTTLNDAGRAFLDVLGQALQNFPCVRIDAMDIGPAAVELKLGITEWRNQREVPPVGSRDWEYYRRIMTLPVFVGYLKMNSGLRINKLRKTEGSDVWTRRYRSRILTDVEEMNALSAELQERWSRVVITPPRRKQEKRSSTLAAVLASELKDANAGSVQSEARGQSPRHLSETMLLGRMVLLTGARRVPPKNGASRYRGYTGAGAGGLSAPPGSVIRSIGPDRIFLAE